MNVCLVNARGFCLVELAPRISITRLQAKDDIMHAKISRPTKRKSTERGLIKSKVDTLMIAVDAMGRAAQITAMPNKFDGKETAKQLISQGDAVFVAFVQVKECYQAAETTSSK
jgi:hypothetical protein